jgi:periplasmic copper chaperone A
MNVPTRRLFLAGIAVLATPSARAHSYRRGAMSIGHAWGLPSDTATTRVMVPLLNEGARADRLTSATSAVADAVALYRGEAPEGELVLTRGRPVAMRPDGLHLRLDGLRRPLAHGDRVPLRLVFEQAGPVEIEVWIEPRPYAGPPPG